jgi:hypothetical protein
MKKLYLNVIKQSKILQRLELETLAISDIKVTWATSFGLMLLKKPAYRFRWGETPVRRSS